MMTIMIMVMTAMIGPSHITAKCATASPMATAIMPANPALAAITANPIMAAITAKAITGLRLLTGHPGIRRITLVAAATKPNSASVEGFRL